MLKIPRLNVGQPRHRIWICNTRMQKGPQMDWISAGTATARNPVAASVG